MTADELRAIIKDLPPIEGDDIWSQHRASLRRHILKEHPENFLAWSTVQATMHVGNAPFISAEYEALKPDWGRWMEAVRWSGYGAFTFHSGSGYASDTNLIHQAYHLTRWERVTGQRVENLDRIIEFGGGYGAMCLLCHRLGFKGKYWLEDSPEFLSLQSYYLSNTAGGGSFYFGLPFEYSCDLFIASHSLSEIPINERRLILSGLDANSFLFVFHCEHDKVDNLEWFRQLARDRVEYEWTSWYTEHLPNQWYQVGVKR